MEPRLEALLREAVGARVAPAIVAEAGRSGGPAWGGAFGALTYAADAPPAGRGTIFDIASLTKAVATATIAMRLFEDGRLDVAARVSELVPGWRGPDRAGATVADLLAHSAGLPGVLPLYEQGAGRAAIERAICGAPLEFPPGSRSVYSDLGFMLLGFILADAAGGGIDGQFDRIAASFVPAAETLRFGPVSAWPGGRSDLARVAPTQVDDWRGRLLQGEVDDRNAAALGGVAGHAGLFGTVGAVGAFAATPWPARQRSSASRGGPECGTVRGRSAGTRC
jgi:CubicO group peptidase (beta-lactamase class C family)